MGTRYSIKLVEPDGAKLSQTDLATVVDAALRKINDQMSTYLTKSEVSQFNRAPANKWFEVSSATATVVQQALRISEQSQGAYDITIGPLVQLWHFGPQTGDRSSLNILPTAEAIRATLKRVGSKYLNVRDAPPALRKKLPGLEIDLSSIAKGYAVDQVGLLLEGQGIANYMVEIGGEVRTRGVRQDGKPWQIGIERPDADGRRVQKIIPLRDLAVATSGDYRIFFDSDGQRYSHLIDPRTGRPVGHALASVSVLADDCTQADALATALLILGPDEGYAWSMKHNLAALFMIRSTASDDKNHHGKIAQKATPRFKQLTSIDLELESELESENSSIWPTLFLAAAVFILAVLSMAIGVITGHRPIRGSCGGLAGLRNSQGHTHCDACTNPSPECQGEPLEKA